MKNFGFKFDTTYTSLPELFYTRLSPDSTRAAKIIVINDELAKSLDFDFTNATKDELTALFSGQQLPDGATPYSQAYAGHQFGYFTMLGDGRAHVWGEHVTNNKQRFDIQFKGSGRTVYARRGDGKAVLGPMLREYIISEAMHHLGVPTTRSLAVVTTGESIMRDSILPGAILTRVASSHIRVGTFEYAAVQQGTAALESLLDYTINRHYPQHNKCDNKAMALLQSVVEMQAELIVHWMRVGFIHGVMNTDNMALSGETIDYGPCAFMDMYNPNMVFSSIDDMGRYAYDNQPRIAQWNIARLAEALLPLIDQDETQAVTIAEGIINQFADIYQQKWLSMMRAKLGLFGEYDADEKLINDLLAWMHNNHADYTNTFYVLGQIALPADKLFQQKDFVQWHQRWQARLNQNEESIDAAKLLMQQTNPAVIPRNHQVEHALDAAYKNDLQPMYQLLNALSDPYNDRDVLKSYQSPPEQGERVYQTFCGT